MVVAELIKELEKYDRSMPVVIDGYEQGVGEFDSVKMIRIALNVYSNDSISRPHENLENVFDDDEAHHVCDAIYLK